MEDWVYEPAKNLDKPLAQQLKDFPREPGLLSHLLRICGNAGLRAFLKTYHRLKIRGRENLPLDRSFIMIANHTSHLDALCLLAAIPYKLLYRTFPAAAADYFFTNLATSAFSAIFINAMPFERKVNGAKSLEICRALLANPGNILILFPEGTRAVDGKLTRFRSGIGRLAVASNVPVVPCRLLGCHEAFGKGRLVPRPKRVSLVIDKPLSFESVPDTKDGVLRVCTELHNRVAAIHRGPC